MRTLAVVLCLAAASTFAEDKPAAESKPRLLVVNLAAQGVSADEAAAMTDAVVQSLSERNLFQVISAKDVQTLLSAERQKQMLGAGCAETSCSTDLGTATDARYVLSGALSRVGSAYELTLQTVDSQKAQAMGRSSRLANDLITLRALVPYAAAEATGSPLPPPRPRWVQYTMIAAGSGLVIGGGVLGMQALSRQNVLNEELCPNGVVAGECDGQNLRPRSYYLDADRSIGRDKTISLVLMGTGAALAAAGIFLLPPPEGGPRVAVLPSPSGVAFAGVLP